MNNQRMHIAVVRPADIAKRRINHNNAVITALMIALQETEHRPTFFREIRARIDENAFIAENLKRRTSKAKI